MTEKRYELDEGTNGPMIYDNTGPDDYYFINDSEELKKFVDSLNDSENTWKENYNHVMGEYKKQLIQINEKDLQISELKKEVLSWMDIAICETSSNYDKEIETECQRIFGCSYKEAVKNIKYASWAYEE